VDVACIFHVDDKVAEDALIVIHDSAISGKESEFLLDDDQSHPVK
jgi:hypothetical protein